MENVVQYRLNTMGFSNMAPKIVSFNVSSWVGLSLDFMFFMVLPRCEQQSMQQENNLGVRFLESFL